MTGAVDRHGHCPSCGGTVALVASDDPETTGVCMNASCEVLVRVDDDGAWRPVDRVN